MANPFFEANDAAMDRAVDLMLGGEPPEPAKSAAPETPVAAPASGSEGTTPSNDDGATPATQDAAGAEPQTEVENVPSSSSEPEVEGFDPQKTLSKYTTPEAKDQALVEKEKELLKRGEENKALRAKLESLEGSKPTKEAEPVESYQAFLQRVHAAKPDELGEGEIEVARSLAALKAEKSELTKIETRITELRKQEATVVNEAARLRTILEAQEADLKAEPDDFALAERIKANQARLDRLERDEMNLRSKRIDETQAYMNAHEGFKSRIVQVESIAQDTHAGVTRNRQEAVASSTEAAALNAKWNEASKTLFEVELKEQNFTPEEREVAMLGLAAALSEYHSKTGEAPTDFLQFMREQKPVFDRISKIRTDAQKALTTRATSTLPNKPRNNEVKGTPRTGDKPSSPTSRNKLFSDAESRFDRALGF